VSWCIEKSVVFFEVDWRYILKTVSEKRENRENETYLCQYGFLRQMEQNALGDEIQICDGLTIGMWGRVIPSLGIACNELAP
jgi:hypothetical protein